MYKKMKHKKLALFSILSFTLLSSFKFLDNEEEYDHYTYNDQFEIYEWDFKPNGTDTKNEKVSHYKYLNSFKFKLYDPKYQNYSLALKTINEDFSFICETIQLNKEYSIEKVVRFDNNYKNSNYFKLVLSNDFDEIVIFNFSTKNIKINKSFNYTYLDILEGKSLTLDTGIPTISNHKFTSLIYIFDFSHLKENDFIFNYGAFDYSRFYFVINENKSINNSIYLNNINVSDYLDFEVHFNATSYAYKERFKGYNQILDNSIEYFYKAKYINGVYNIVQENLDYYKVIKDQNPLFMVNIHVNNLDNYINNMGYRLADMLYFGSQPDFYLVDADIEVTLKFSVFMNGIFIKFPLKLNKRMYYDASQYYLSSKFIYSLTNYSEEIKF